MKLRSFQDANKFLESFIKPTVFERIEENSRLGDPLDRMRVLLQLLDNPEKKFKSVQVSGTSGKGSTAYLISCILEKSGYKTGLATSPHLQSITERMQINMRKISEQDLINLVNKLSPVIQKMQLLPVGEPSYFELVTALSFMHFAYEKVDIAIVEVGLEGKYDATNVLEPLMVVITNISKDHTELLGSTEVEIAHEALSIVHNNEAGSRPAVVTGIKQKEILAQLSARADQDSLAVKVIGRDFDFMLKNRTQQGSIFDFKGEKLLLDKLDLRLRGGYQVVNASLAIAASESLVEFGFKITGKSVREALKTAFFPGRFEVIKSDNKFIILDGAHNEAKMKAFLKALSEYFPHEKKTFIVGFKTNKDVLVMLTELFKEDKADFIFTQFHRSGGYAGSFSMAIANLHQCIKQINKAHDYRFTDDIQQALDKTLRTHSEIVVVTGSLYLVGEVREYLLPIE